MLINWSPAGQTCDSESSVGTCEEQRGVELHTYLLKLEEVWNCINYYWSKLTSLLHIVARFHAGEAKQFFVIPHCIKGESNPRRVDGNDPGYHYPINAMHNSTQHR